MVESLPMPVVLGQVIWLSLRFVPVAAAVVVAAAAAVAWLYPPQVRALGRGWQWALPALRVAALAALAGSILRPVALRPRTGEEEGAVVVLVDRSRSMGVVDARPSPAKLVALADGLGWLAAGVRENPYPELRTYLERIEGLGEDVARAQQELDYARLADRGVARAQARLDQAREQYAAVAERVRQVSPRLPKSEGMPARFAAVGRLPNFGQGGWLAAVKRQCAAAKDALDRYQVATDAELYERNAEVRAACDRAAGMSRFALVEEALTRPGSGLLSKVAGRSPVFGFAFADGVTPLPLTGGGEPVRRLLVEPNGDGTDVAGALSEVLERLKGVAVRAIVLFSDGRQTIGGGSVPSSLSASGVPVLSVLAGMASVPDVAVTDVVLPTSQFVGEPLGVRARVRCTGLAGAKVDAVLSVGDERRTAAVALEKGRTSEVTFPPIRLRAPGPQRVVVSVPALAGEVGVENNRAERWVKVLSDRVKVAVASGEAGGDYPYVREALGRTPWVKLQEAVLESGGARFPLGPQKILEQDVIVLMDVPAVSLEPRQWQAVYRWVSQRGGNLILAAGEKHLPGEYGRGPVQSELVPWRGGTARPVWRVWAGEEPFFRLVPAAGAEGMDWLRLDEGQEVAQGWYELPAMYRCVPLANLKPGVRPLLVERDSQLPVMTEARVSLGRVFFLGTDETWRWRSAGDGREQDRFWQQLVRYAAEEPYAVVEGRVALDADRVSLEPGESVRVRARVEEPNGAPSQAKRQELRVFKGGELVRVMSMSAAGVEGTGRYEAMLGGLAQGDYELRVAGEGAGGQQQGVMLPLHVERSVEREVADLSAEPSVLEKLSSSSGGATLPLEQVGRIPDKLAEARERQPRMTEQPLWDSPYLFVFVLACLGLEWGLRKGFGLA